MRKLRVGLIFGGRSGEHDVSLLSARSILQALDPDRYEVVPIAITREGRWLVAQGVREVQEVLEGGQLRIAGEPAAILPDPQRAGVLRVREEEPGRRELMASAIRQVDVVFPVLHGPFGEDGTIQGLLELAGIPYVGAGVAASAAGMDKAMMKALFVSAGIPVLPYEVFTRPAWERDAGAIKERIASRLGYPCFTKPANLGSSVGIRKVHGPGELEEAVAFALTYDRKLVVEKAAEGCREVECSVLGNDDPQASIAGEIVPRREFYDYRAKYLEDTTELIIPARISEAATRRVQELAVAAFQAIDCAGMARVDFFVHKTTEEVWVNEINTIPGFTRISMYPKLWEHSGLPFPKLVDRLIELALERHAERQRIALAQQQPVE